MNNGNVFVTYKSLFATAISILIVTLGLIYFAHNSFTGILNSKADIKLVEIRTDGNAARITLLCNQLEKMENKQDEMLRELYNIKTLVKR